MKLRNEFQHALSAYGLSNSFYLGLLFLVVQYKV